MPLNDQERILIKLESEIEDTNERLAKLEEKVQNTNEQLIRLDSKIEDLICTEMKHIAEDVKEIKTLGESLRDHERMLTQHEQELERLPRMEEDIKKHDGFMHRTNGIFLVAGGAIGIFAGYVIAAIHGLVRL